MIKLGEKIYLDFGIWMKDLLVIGGFRFLCERCIFFGVCINGFKIIGNESFKFI